MLVVPQSVKVKWNASNRCHYESKGYKNYVHGQEFLVDVLDLTSGSKVVVRFICDYCFEEKTKVYHNHVKCTVNGIVKKDACDSRKCQRQKAEESNLIRYGVSSTNSLDSVKNKKRQIFALPHEKVKQLFESRDYIMLDHYINSQTPIRYICKKHSDKGVLTITYSHLNNGKGCKYCHYDSISGENHYNWSGGETSLATYLRDQLRCWTFDSLKSTDFKCTISGDKKKLEVHHHINFRDIVKETLELLNLPLLKSYHFYSEKELNLITERCKELHYLYGLGTPLRKDIHALFHSIYGKKNNTLEQLNEFIQSINENKIELNKVV